jgi:iron complex outermembrane recepter protein
MKQILFIAACIVSSISIYAQKTLKGRVVDAFTNHPLSGATVSFQNKTGITTDKDGYFTIDCSKNTIITVSFIGYESRQQGVSCNETLIVSLTPSNNTLANVEITATSAQNKAILYQPQSINKLNPVELKRGTGLFLDDAINGNVPGVIMQRRAVSSGQSFNIRGYGNGIGGTGRINSNFDGQGYKVYLNGIPITDAEGITLMDDIDFGSIGNVEIIKGPSGTLFGQAIAGVVNLKTITPEKGKTSIGQEVLIGNYGLRRFTTHFAMGGEHSSVLINYGNQQSDGFTIHNTSTKNFANIAAEFRPTDKESISTYFGYSNSYDQRSGELTITQYNANDFSGNPEYIKRNAHSEVISFRAGVTNFYSFNKTISNSTTVFGTGVSNNASSAGGWTDKDPINYGFRTSFNTKFVLNNDVDLSGITGIEAQRQNAQTVGYGMADPQGASHVWKMGDPYFIITASTSNKLTTTSTASYFTEWTLSLPHDLSVTGGVGYSAMKIHLNDRFYIANSTLPRTFDTAYKSMVSPHLAINKVFSKEISVYAAYSKGYKAPTSSYFYIPATGAIVKNLEPEIGNQFEIGTKGSLLNSRLSYQLALFDAIFSNKMTAINVLNTAGTATLYTYVANGGKQNDKGIEFLVKYVAYQSGDGFIKSFAPFGNFTYSNFKYDNYSFHYKGKVQIDSVVNYDGKKVAGVPDLIANIGFDLATKPGVYFNTIYMYKKGFPFTSDNLNNTSSYGLVNAKIGYQGTLSRHFDLNAYFGVNNIAGKKYPIAVFVNQLPDAYLLGPTKANYELQFLI